LRPRLLYQGAPFRLDDGGALLGEALVAGLQGPDETGLAKGGLDILGNVHEGQA
jgi:hypothetical protein